MTVAQCRILRCTPAYTPGSNSRAARVGNIAAACGCSTRYIAGGSGGYCGCNGCGGKGNLVAVCVITSDSSIIFSGIITNIDK